MIHNPHVNQLYAALVVEVVVVVVVVVVEPTKCTKLYWNELHLSTKHVAIFKEVKYIQKMKYTKN